MYVLFTTLFSWESVNDDFICHENVIPTNNCWLVFSLILCIYLKYPQQTKVRTQTN